MNKCIKCTITNSVILVEHLHYVTGEEEEIFKRFIENFEDSNKDLEIFDDLIKNAAQPLYDKIIKLDSSVSVLARIATEHSESYPADYQKLSNFLNRKG